MSEIISEKYYDSQTKRVHILTKCGICEQKRIMRYDYYKKRYLTLKKEIRCRKCASIKRQGYGHSTGYIIRHYRSFPVDKWGLLMKMCKGNGQIKEHRAIMAIQLNRPLNENEIIHHKNGIRDDNRIENLEICIFRQPPGQRMTDLIEEIHELKEKIKYLEKCLYEK